MESTKNFRFYNRPNEHSADDYKEATEYIIEKYSNINNLTSIYNWGVPSIPGISDIDIVLVFDKIDNKALPISKRSFYLLNSKTRYLARHPFMFIDSNSFRNIKYIYPDTNFKLLHGNPVKIKKISSNEKYFACAALLNDIIIRHYPRDFLEQQINREINVRDTLLRLNSLKYSVSALKYLTNESCSEWKHALQLIGKLRKNWFERNDFELLISLNSGAIGIAMQITDKFKEFLIKNGVLRINSGNKIVYNGIKNRTLFIDGWIRRKSLEDMYHLAIKWKKFYSILPLELAAQQVEYSRHKGLISSYIKKRISNHLTYQMRHKKILEKRIGIFNNQAKLALKLRHSDFAAFFDFGYRSTAGINNIILNLLDKARF